jgi:hypothetical protein
MKIIKITVSFFILMLIGMFISYGDNENSEYDYLKEWNITSNDKRFEMTFTPLINRSSLTDIKILISDQNQVFGKFNGFLVLNDGKKIEVKDFLGFIERVRNKW